MPGVRSIAAWLLLVSPLVAGETVRGSPNESVSTPGFRNDVQPVLTKAGCNSGACHGAAAGKNGFKLSLRGYDPAADHAVLTRQAAVRRVNRERPDESLLLRKPLGQVQHGGGQRFEEGSPEHRHKAWTACVILKGPLRIGEKWHQAGDVIVIEPNIWYGPLEAGPEGAELLEIHASMPGVEPIWRDPTDPAVQALFRWLERTGRAAWKE